MRQQPRTKEDGIVIVQSVPLLTSLDSDAPGWGQQVQGPIDQAVKYPDDEQQRTKGPICWKCRGSKQNKRKITRQSLTARKQPEPSSSTTTIKEEITGSMNKSRSLHHDDEDEKKVDPTIVVCTVCSGTGRIPMRSITQQQQQELPVGRITRACRPPDYQIQGPMPVALQQKPPTIWTKLVWTADQLGIHQSIPPQKQQQQHLLDTSDNSNNSNINNPTIVGHDDDSDDNSWNHPPPPPWIPQKGEELCRLTGSWRILQRVKNHRWTTDDLCTAWVASKEILVPPRPSFFYLDLGTGNSSVLHMVLWSFLNRTSLEEHRPLLHAVGLEARREAVELARRSLAFNLGRHEEEEGEANVEILHADFRSHEFPNQTRFDLITGTPPYFKVDFHVRTRDNQVTCAVIQQGGMPTSTASAPARCEFRGGFEAYTEAAAKWLKPDTGRFVVCENWANHDRVWKAAQQSNLTILKWFAFEGRVGRGILFAVYVMSRQKQDTGKTPSGKSQCDERQSSSAKMTMKEQSPDVIHLTIRDEDGKWTRQYLDTVMHDMNMPTLMKDRAAVGPSPTG